MDPELINILNRTEVEVGDYPEAPPPKTAQPAAAMVEIVLEDDPLLLVLVPVVPSPLLKIA